MDIISYLQSFDIIGLVETWSTLKGEFDSLLQTHTHFDFVRKRHISALRNSGGVSVFVKHDLVRNDFVSQICSHFTDCIVLYVKASVFHLMNDIILYIAYVSPEGSSIYNDSSEKNGIVLLEENISYLKSAFPECYLYLAGDMNSRTKDFSDFIHDDSVEHMYNTSVNYDSDTFDMPRANKDTERYNQYGKCLVNLCCSHNIHILNGRLHDDKTGNFTCIANEGHSVVDYHIASTELFPYVSYFNVEQRDESDHYPLYAQLKFTGSIQPRNFVTPQQNVPVVPVDSFKWKSTFQGEFAENFRTNIRSQFNKIVSCIAENVDLGVQCILEVYKLSAQKMRVRRVVHTNARGDQTQPAWWDNECEQAKSCKYSLLRRFRWSNIADDFSLYKQARNKFKSICDRKKSQLQYDKRTELMRASRNPTLFWSLLKRDHISKASPRNDINAANWMSYFNTLLFKDNQTPLTMLTAPREETGQADLYLNSPITDDEIRHGIDHLKTGKAHGPDGLSAEFYKSTKVLIAPILNVLFNKILDSGEFPDTWSHCIIVPIFKAGSRDDPANYRGISLLNVMYKIFSCIITDRITKWADETGAIDEAQAGFRTDYSVTDQIFTLQSMVEKYISRPRGRFYVLYVDFKKAFDSLVHFKLFNVLIKNGIQGKLLNILISMYSSLKAQVRLDCNTHGNSMPNQNAAYSENNSYNTQHNRMPNRDAAYTCTTPFACNIGTRQGDLSSPIIFNLFINELCTYIRSKCRNGIFITEDIPDIFCILFADDVANCADTANNLQCQLNHISDFCHNTGMEINLTKTEIIVFRNGGPLRGYESWHYNGQPIKTTSVYKYLGMLFTPTLSWSAAKSKLAAQARKAMFAIKQYQLPYGHFLPSEMFKIFDAMVLPILVYGSQIWGHTYSPEIEQIQLQFCKYYLGVNSSVNNSMVLGECGRLPLCVYYHTICIKYWCKLLYMSSSRYPRNCYKMLMSLDDIGRKTWVSQVKQLLFKYGFGIVWISQDVGDPGLFLRQFKQRVTDCMTQSWHEDINNSSRCDLYKQIKSLLEPEKYLSLNISHKLKSALARFRCSNHKFRIETGRHEGIDRCDRNCTHCSEKFQIQATDDEFHVFFVCHKFNDVRAQYLLNWYKGRNSRQDFHNLLVNQNPIVLRNLAQFIGKLME